MENSLDVVDDYQIFYESLLVDTTMISEKEVIDAILCIDTNSNNSCCNNYSNGSGGTQQETTKILPSMDVNPVNKDTRSSNDVTLSPGENEIGLVCGYNDDDLILPQESTDIDSHKTNDKYHRSELESSSTSSTKVPQSNYTEDFCCFLLQECGVGIVKVQKLPDFTNQPITSDIMNANINEEFMGTDELLCQLDETNNPSVSGDNFYQDDPFVDPLVEVEVLKDILEKENPPAVSVTANNAGINDDTNSGAITVEDNQHGLAMQSFFDIQESSDTYDHTLPQLEQKSIRPTQEELDSQATKRAKKDLKSWWKHFYELEDFKRQYGHCNVSKTEHKLYKKLATWVNKQREEKKRLKRNLRTSFTRERLELLESIGFEWAKPKLEVNWELRFQELVQFKEEHGHCDVPTKTKVLGRWVSTQRNHYKEWLKEQEKQKADEANNQTNSKSKNKITNKRNNNMTKEKVDRLNKLGFTWVRTMSTTK